MSEALSSSCFSNSLSISSGPFLRKWTAGPAPAATGPGPDVTGALAAGLAGGIAGDEDDEKAGCLPDAASAGEVKPEAGVGGRGTGRAGGIGGAGRGGVITEEVGEGGANVPEAFAIGGGGRGEVGVAGFGGALSTGTKETFMPPPSLVIETSNVPAPLTLNRKLVVDWLIRAAFLSSER